MWSIKGKVAVVTGASGALGRAVAAQLAYQHGAIVGLVSYRHDIAPLTPPSPPSLPSACSTCPSLPQPSAETNNNNNNNEESVAVPALHLPHKSRCFTADITGYHACQTLFQHVHDTLGPVSLVVNCAGVTLSKVFLRCSEEDYNRVMDLNLRGAVYLTQAALRYGGLRSPSVMESGGGGVVLVGSVAGTRGNEGQVLYSASKAALSGVVQSLAKEYGSKKLRFNVVAPGLIAETPMAQALSEAQREAWGRQTTLGRCATVEEVAQVVVNVGLSSFISGQTIEVNGGAR